MINTARSPDRFDRELRGMIETKGGNLVRTSAHTHDAVSPGQVGPPA
jgi:hypothetical protein